MDVKDHNEHILQMGNPCARFSVIIFLIHLTYSQILRIKRLSHYYFSSLLPISKVLPKNIIKTTLIVKITYLAIE